MSCTGPEQEPTWKLTRAQGIPGAESSNTCWKSMRSSDSSTCMSETWSARLPGPSAPALSPSLPASRLATPAPEALGECALSAAVGCVSLQTELVKLFCDGSDLRTLPACACAAVDGAEAGCASALDPGKSKAAAAPASCCNALETTLGSAQTHLCNGQRRVP